MKYEIDESVLKYEYSPEHIAIITLDLQGHPANILNEKTWTAIFHAFGKAASEPKLKGIILTSAKRDFLAGGDLRSMASLREEEKEKLFHGLCSINDYLRKIETSGKPVVAALNGSAIGGGLELALACHHRIALNTSDSKIGLTEVKLGLIPGSGGTQRLPRLIGIQKSLEFILQGRLLSPSEAWKEGLVHELADHPEELRNAANRFILNGGSAVQPWDQPGFSIPGGGIATPKGVETLAGSISLTRKNTHGNYPAAQYALSAVYEGLFLPIERGTTVEARYFTKVLFSKEARNIIRSTFFHIGEANKGKAKPNGFPFYKVNRLGVLGAGLMGAGIAYVSAKAGLEVILKDRTVELAEKGKENCAKILEYGLKKGRTTPEKAQAILSRIHPTADSQAVAPADLVIEAVFENSQIKATVTRESEAVLAESAVYASNTSTIPISELAIASKRPQNFIGIHFFSPVHRMPLVEIIRGKETSDYALAAAIDYVLQIGKTPIVVNDSRGFYTSRVFGKFTTEGVYMLTEGVPATVIENVAKKAGMPIGPLAVSDEVNLGLSFDIMKQTERDLGLSFDNDPAAQLLTRFVQEFQRLGKKQGKGFYDYPANGKKHLWPDLKKFFPERNDWDEETVRKRLLHVQALDAYRCLEEGVLQRPEDGDIGSILGWGFPPFTGGALSYIDYIGAQTFIDECLRFTDQFGERFAVPESLNERAKQGRRFYHS